MDFALSEEQGEIKRAATEFAKGEFDLLANFHTDFLLLRVNGRHSPLPRA